MVDCGSSVFYVPTLSYVFTKNNVALLVSGQLGGYQLMDFDEEAYDVKITPSSDETTVVGKWFSCQPFDQSLPLREVS
ncbi:hypothetical protein JTE90_029530 [Oedothorax gibbosus]|uniref:Peptidase A1 domain-containing protein n=1 Tax=Oedothorax gibbosus TaxID=931172 RepID=A0AAV6VDQ9_9ARAC|nr:hypothetical protein JTE90_029530 [Oedothorax gibbosus]